jgi:hypothetical protein
MAPDSAVIPESTDPSASREASDRRPAPWRGRKRTEEGEAKDEFIAVRVTKADRARITEKAQESGLKIGGYLRALALGSAGPRAVKRPRVEREQLARILGETGKLRSNVNQIAKWANTEKSPASQAVLEQIHADITLMRDAVMQALNHGD